MRNYPGLREGAVQRLTLQDIAWFRKAFANSPFYEEWFHNDQEFDSPQKDRQIKLLQQELGINKDVAGAAWSIAADFVDDGTDQQVVHYASSYLRDVAYETYKVAVRKHTDLSQLTIEQFWSLPIVWSVTDDRRANIEWIKAAQPDVQRAKKLAANTHVDYEIAKLFTKCLKLTHVLPSDNEHDEHYNELEYRFVDQAARTLRLVELAERKDRTLRKVINAYVERTLTDLETPNLFLRRRLVGIAICIVLITILETLVIKQGKLALIGIVSVIGLAGVGFYSLTPFQFAARKTLLVYLREKGIGDD